MRWLTSRGRKRVLDPAERTAEVLFGLIMVLTFTGSLSVSSAGPADIHAMLIGALGCNVAWGVIDGVLYLMGVLAEKTSSVTLLRQIRNANDGLAAHALIASAAPALAWGLQPDDADRVRRRLRELPAPPLETGLNAEDWRGACGVCVLVVLATFPVGLPFLFMHDAMLALRVSNAIAIAMLFVVGLSYGRAIERSPWLIAWVMVLLGMVLVALTIALGG